MYTFETDDNVIGPVSQIRFKVAAERRNNVLRTLQAPNPFLGRVVRKVAELVPDSGVLPDEYAGIALRAADEAQAAEGNIDNKLYLRAGQEVLALCKRAAEGDMEPGTESDEGRIFQKRVEESVAYQLAFTPYIEEPERRP